MMRKHFLTWFAVLMGTCAFAVDAIDLGGLWEFRLCEWKSLEDVMMPKFAPEDRMLVPGCWDVLPRYYNKRGTGCFRRTFELSADASASFLVVDGFALRLRAWIDGREVGFSALPWSKVEFKVGALSTGRHEVVLAVDSLSDENKTKMFWDYYDFYAHGGLYHGVSLEVAKSPDEIRRLSVRVRDYRTGLVEVESHYAENGPEDFTAAVSFDGRPPTSVAFKARRAILEVPDFRLWSPDEPNLHRVSVNGTMARFGVRQVATAGKRILLNGRPIYLKGVNRHESHPQFGASTPRQLMFEDIANVKDLGGNFIRGSHYPQCAEFLDLCDELGILVWEESLGWGDGKQLSDPEFCRLQEEQTRLMVRESINHPSVVVSGFLNEPAADLPECRALVDRLAAAVRAEDTGHLVAYATCRNDTDKSSYSTDIIAFNAYPCQYVYQMKRGSEEEMRDCIRRCYSDIIRYFRDTYRDDRPILITETGVKADYGMRDPLGKAQNTEDFQAQFERTMLEEIFQMPEIAGVAIWQYSDARTYTRVGTISARPYGVNTGGLYDLYRRPKLAVDEVRRMFMSKKSDR